MLERNGKIPVPRHDDGSHASHLIQKSLLNFDPSITKVSQRLTSHHSRYVVYLLVELPPGGEAR